MSKVSVQSLYTKHKSIANSAVSGLNAAAIIFLYTHFVSINDYNKSTDWIKQIQQQNNQLKSDIEVLKTEMQIANPTFPRFYPTIVSTNK